jgi:hypothetical protein
MLLLALHSNKLRLSADTDQNCRTGALERGDHGARLGERHIQPGPSPHTLQLHVHCLFGVEALLARHRLSCVLHSIRLPLRLLAPPSSPRGGRDLEPVTGLPVSRPASWWLPVPPPVA